MAQILVGAGNVTPPMSPATTPKPTGPSALAQKLPLSIPSPAIRTAPSVGPLLDANDGLPTTSGSDPPLPVARTYALTLDKDRETLKRLPYANTARAARTFRVWTDSALLKVRTPEIALKYPDAQVWIRLAFKPSTHPLKTRAFVYISEANSQVPVESLGFDLDYV